MEIYNLIIKLKKLTGKEISWMINKQTNNLRLKLRFTEQTNKKENPSGRFEIASCKLLVRRPHTPGPRGHQSSPCFLPCSCLPTRAGCCDSFLWRHSAPWLYDIQKPSWKRTGNFFPTGQFQSTTWKEGWLGRKRYQWSYLDVKLSAKIPATREYMYTCANNGLAVVGITTNGILFLLGHIPQEGIPYVLL